MMTSTRPSAISGPVEFRPVAGRVPGPGVGAGAVIAGRVVVAPGAGGVVVGAGIVVVVVVVVGGGGAGTDRRDLLVMPMFVVQVLFAPEVLGPAPSS